ncbi:uncharacterized protein LOC126379602 [Pectinophora gossypiella]|uniref:uncharacterized protein LOC126379602 n=1 Tax=Pectinophora gossypiella TaxID=13191 RepID=UPI00214EA1AC|nr:uncharacterized protein LOC126379602 [Pectinophora gossypiella]
MSYQLELLTENPSQWTTVSYVTPEIQKKEIKPFVILALKELEGVPDSRTSSLMCADKFAAVRGVVRHVARLRSATRLPWARDDLKVFLEGLQFTPECVSELSTLLCTEGVYASVPPHLRVKPGLAALHWRIDLSLSQARTPPTSPPAGPASRRTLLQQHTHVILLLTTTDGRTSTYRLLLAKFHELRFAVASALKSMIVLEKRKCMRKD